MRILFWGTPDFALPPLRALLGEGYPVVGVVTRPDRPAGRGRKLRPSPVKALALEEGVPVLTPEQPRGEAFLSELRALRPDLSVVVAYGHILRAEVLALPRLGSVNIHASLLPALRGAAPIHWAIVRGHRVTGVSIMQMDEGMDSGPVLLRRQIPIEPDDTVSALTARLSELGAEALLETLPLLEELTPEPQDHALATFAPRIDRETARVAWDRSPREVVDHVRGMDAVPGAWTEFQGEPLKLFRPREVPRPPGTDSAPPGRWVGEPAIFATGPAPDPGGPGSTATGERPGAVAFDEVQPPGKRRMPAEDWARGRPRS